MLPPMVSSLPGKIDVLFLKFKIGSAKLDHFCFSGFQNLGQFTNFLQKSISFTRVATFRMTRYRR